MSQVASEQRSAGRTARSRPRSMELAVAGWVFLIIAGHLEPMLYDAWAPRASAAIAIGPLGLLLIAFLARSGDAPARWAVAFLACSFLAAMFSPAAVNSVLGFPERNMSVVMLALYFSAWALGRFVPTSAHPYAEVGLVLGLALQLLVGLTQVTFDIYTGALASFPGRASGLASNPVYYGALMAGGAGFACSKLAVTELRRWWAVAALSVVGVVLSGSRVALLSVVIVASCIVLLYRPGILVVSATGSGLVAGALISVLTASRGAATRLTDVGEASSGGRADAWRSALAAVGERPLIGWGPGQFRTSIQGHVPDSAADLSEPLSGVWTDPHNLVVLLLTTTGVVGVVLAAGFVYSSGRQASGPWLAASCGVVITWILQPLSIVTAPLALFMLGLAMPTGPSRRLMPRSLVVSCLLVGSLLSVALLAVDWNARNALRSGDAHRLEEAATLYGRDPKLMDEAAQTILAQAVLGAEPVDVALDVAARPSEIEPENAHWWASLAVRQELFGRLDDALTSAQRSVALQPNNPTALNVLDRLAGKQP